MDEVRVTREGGVVRLTLHRPERKNALSPPMWVELARVLEEVAARDEDRVLVLGGAGGVFCAGGDLSAGRGGRGGSAPPPPPHAGRTLSAMGAGVTRLCLALHRLPKPTLAAVDGVAAGAGANLALGCDLVIASERARFAELFVHRALPMDSGGTWLLPRLIGLQRAKELAFFGDWVEAPRALELGLVNRVVPVEELDGAVDAWARRLAELAPTALAWLKRGLNRSFETDFAQTLDDEAAGLALCVSTPETAEAVRAFLEKRRASR